VIGPGRIRLSIAIGLGPFGMLGMLGILGMLRWAVPVLAHKPTTTKFTYYRDVFPILQTKCGACHKTGGVAPMSLLDYKSTYPWAASIKNQVLALAMPPWFADERFGSFEHDGTLSANEVNTIVDWCLGGTPEGAREPGAEPDSQDGERDSSALGEPDVLLELPEPVVLGADESDAVKDVELDAAPASKAERFLRAIEFRPGSANVVRSALVFIAPKGSAPTPDRLVASWISGERGEVLPQESGVPLPAGSSIWLRIHYKKTWLDDGKEVSDRSRLALYFRKTPPPEKLSSIVVAVAGDEPIRADGADFETSKVLTLHEGVSVLALLPRVETSLESFLAEAILPDGATRTLIRLRQPQPDWPRTFWLAERVALPKETRIRLTLASTDEESLKAPHAFWLDVVRE
jgi:hypothetical protein